MAVGLTGRIQTGSYTNKDGVKVYTTDVVVERVEFVGKKAEGNKNSEYEGFEEFNEEELPF